MSIKSFFKKLFGKAEKKVETTIDITPNFDSDKISVVETKAEPVVVDVEKETKAIETRLAEIAEEKKAEKVTAKEIKAKVKKTPEVKTDKSVDKPVKTEKPSSKQSKNSLLHLLHLNLYFIYNPPSIYSSLEKRGVAKLFSLFELKRES
jgi:regulator of replication initiation timing